MGEKQNGPFQLFFNASLKVEFQGSRVTSDGGLVPDRLTVREDPGALLQLQDKAPVVYWHSPSDPAVPAGADVAGHS